MHHDIIVEQVMHRPQRLIEEILQDQDPPGVAAASLAIMAHLNRAQNLAAWRCTEASAEGGHVQVLLGDVHEASRLRPGRWRRMDVARRRCASLACVSPWTLLIAAHIAMRSLTCSILTLPIKPRHGLRGNGRPVCATARVMSLGSSNGCDPDSRRGNVHLSRASFPLYDRISRHQERSWPARRKRHSSLGTALTTLPQMACGFVL